MIGLVKLQQQIFDVSLLVCLAREAIIHKETRPQSSQWAAKTSWTGKARYGSMVWENNVLLVNYNDCSLSYVSSVSKDEMNAMH